MTRRLQRAATCVALLVLATVACGGDDDDDGASGNAAGSDGGNTGGSTSTGGSTAAGGNISTGGAPGTGGDTAAGGSISTGGDTATGGTGGGDLDARITTFCINKQANGYVRGCTKVFTSGYLAACEADLTAAAANCASQVDAMIGCASTASVLDYECDADGDVVFAPGVCSAETTALEQCRS